MTSGALPAGGAEPMVAGIYLAPAAEAPIVSVSEVRALPGRGLEGDRYCRAAGTFSKGHEPDAELTLIELEAVEAFNHAHTVSLGPGEFRRNLVTQGVALNELAGQEFMVGDVRVRGHGLCEPCRHLQRLTRQPAVLKGLIHRGGLRAQILTAGMVRVGNRIQRI